MVRCNLAVLLAERNVKISQVFKETGISRTTLTALASNKYTGMQFDTIESLCSFLNVTPGQLIGYTPVNMKLIGVGKGLKIESESLEHQNVSFQDQIELSVSFGHGTPASKCCLNVAVNASALSSMDSSKYDIIVTASIIFSLPTLSSQENTETISRAFSQLTRPFLSDFERDFSYSYAAISEPLNRLHCGGNSKRTGLNFSFVWPSELLALLK